MHYLFLTLAIIAEVVATSALKSSQGFTRLVPSLVVVAGYGTAFYLLSLCLQNFSIGIVYAIWSGAGIVLIALIGLMLHGERLDLPAIVGMALILVGVVVINVFSKTAVH